MVSLVTMISMLIMPVQSAMAGPAPGKVDLVLLPATLTVNPGDNFGLPCKHSVALKLQMVSKLTWISILTIWLCSQSTQGTTLPVVLQPATWNNTLGTIDFSAGQLSTPPAYPSGNFTVLTIKFTAKTVLATSNTRSLSTHLAREKQMLF